MDLATALERIIQLVSDVTFVPVAIGLVLVLTQVIKVAFRITSGSTAALIALGVQVAIWVIYSLLKARGMEAEFEQWTRAAEVILTSLLSVLFPAVLATAGAHAAYNRLHDNDVPGFQTGTHENRVQAANAPVAIDGKP